MDQESRPVPLTAEEIERRFRSVPVVVTRPLVRGGLKTLSVFRRFGWTSVGAADLLDLEPPVVFAANHLSHADTAAIMDTLPRPIRSRTAVAAALDVFGPSSTGRSLRNEALQLIVAAGFHAFAFDRHGPPLRSIRTSTSVSVVCSPSMWTVEPTSAPSWRTLHRSTYERSMNRPRGSVTISQSEGPRT